MLQLRISRTYSSGAELRQPQSEKAPRLVPLASEPTKGHMLNARAASRRVSGYSCFLNRACLANVRSRFGAIDDGRYSGQ
jgi:hypothetical protein